MKYRYHPAAESAYFLSVILLSIITLHPVLIMEALLCTVALALLCRAGRLIKRILFSLFVIIAVTLTNPLFSHSGETVLFFIEDMAITLEALIYGLFLGMALASAINLFLIFSACLDSERAYALLGGISPKLALVFSMTLRLVPTLTRKYKDIVKASKVSGEFDGSSPWRSTKSYLSCFSILMTYAMESGIETSDAMKARGYGVGKRTFYSKFKFIAADIFACSFIFATDLVCVAVTVASGAYTYYPSFSGIPYDACAVTLYTAYGALCLLPFVLHIFFELSRTNLRKNRRATDGAFED